MITEKPVNSTHGQSKRGRAQWERRSLGSRVQRTLSDRDLVLTMKSRGNGPGPSNSEAEAVPSRLARGAGFFLKRHMDHGALAAASPRHHTAATPSGSRKGGVPTAGPVRGPAGGVGPCAVRGAPKQDLIPGEASCVSGDEK